MLYIFDFFAVSSLTLLYTLISYKLTSDISQEANIEYTVSYILDFISVISLYDSADIYRNLMNQKKMAEDAKISGVATEFSTPFWRASETGDFRPAFLAL